MIVEGNFSDFIQLNKVSSTTLVLFKDYMYCFTWDYNQIFHSKKVRQFEVFEKSLLYVKIVEKITNMADEQRSLHIAEPHSLIHKGKGKAVPLQA